MYNNPVCQLVKSYAESKHYQFLGAGRHQISAAGRYIWVSSTGEYVGYGLEETRN